MSRRKRLYARLVFMILLLFGIAGIFLLVFIIKDIYKFNDDIIGNSLKGYELIDERAIIDDNQIKELKIDFPGEVTVERTDEKNIKLDVEKNENMKIGYKIESGKLKIDTSFPKHSKSTGNLKISIPKDIKIQDADVESISGKVDFDLDSEELSISGINGNIKIKGSIKNIDIETVNGDAEVELTDVSKSIDMDAVNGDLILIGNSDNISARISSISGKIIDTNKNEHKNSLDQGNKSLDVSMDSVNGDLVLKK